MAKYSQLNLLGSSQQESSKSKSSGKAGRESDTKSYPPTINAVAQPKSAPDTATPATNQQSNKEQKKLTCILCKKDHRIASCPDFNAKSNDERARLVKELGCCLNCLSKGHLGRDCLSKKRCGVEGCSVRHHTLLHGAARVFSISQLPSDGPEQTTGDTIPKVMVAAYCVDDEDITILLQVVPVVIESGGRQKETFGFMDPGSEASIIINKTADQLNMKGPKETACLGTYHGQDPSFETRRVDFKVRPLNSDKSFNVK